MTGEKLTKKELQLFRDIPIHKIVGKINNGRKTTMACPFHSESTPGNAFWLYPDNSFYCFSCKVSGSGSIDFLMKLGGTFEETLEHLSQYL